MQLSFTFAAIEAPDASARLFAVVQEPRRVQLDWRQSLRRPEDKERGSKAPLGIGCVRNKAK
jgi:hypothetical protein